MNFFYFIFFNVFYSQSVRDNLTYMPGNCPHPSCRITLPKHLQDTDRWDPLEMIASALQKRVIYEELWDFNPRLPNCVSACGGREVSQRPGIKAIFGEVWFVMKPAHNMAPTFHAHVSLIKMGSGSKHACTPPTTNHACLLSDTQSHQFAAVV